MGTSTILRPIACVIFSVAVGALPSHQVLGQVVIREGVTVGHSAAVEQSGTAATSMTMPFDGWLDVTYGPSAYSSVNPIATTENLFASSGPDTVGIDTNFVTTRWVLSGTGSGFCYAPATKYNFSPNTANNVWRAGPVQEGQVVVLSSTILFPQATYIQVNDSTWSAVFQRPDGCAEMYLGVQAVRDSLTLEFSPAADAGAVLEPGLEITATARVRGAGDIGWVLFEIVNGDYRATEEVDELIMFVDGTDTTLTLDPVPVDGDTAVAHLVVTDHLGAVEVTASYIIELPAKGASSATTVRTKIRDWPLDRDDDYIDDVWEIGAGGLCLSDPSKEGGCEDDNWDGEHVPEIDARGDGITKLREYQGYTIGGGDKMRTDPINDMDVFVDVHRVPEAIDAVQRAQEDLGLTWHIVSGLKHEGEELEPGDAHLEWVGPVKEIGAVNYIVFVTDDDPVPFYSRLLRYADTDLGPVYDPVSHQIRGLVIEESVYQYNGLKLSDPACLAKPTCSTETDHLADRLGRAPTFGWARGRVRFGKKTAVKYHLVNLNVTAIDNFWDNNSLDRKYYHQFSISNIYDEGQRWTQAIYEGGDDQTGLANLVLALSNGVVRSTDDKLLGWTKYQLKLWTLLHELGHAIGIHRDFLGGHYPTSESVMAVGFGSHMPLKFSDLDEETVELREIGRIPKQ